MRKVVTVILAWCKNLNMQNSHMHDRASSLVNSLSAERQRVTQEGIAQIRSQMNARGLLFPGSSIYANEVCAACSSELLERAKLIWDSVRRAHESCGANATDNLHELFLELIEKEKSKLELIQQSALADLFQQLQNPSLININLVTDIYNNILNQYSTEIDIYLGNLKHSSGKSHFEKYKNSFLNNKLIAALVLVVLIISAVAAFTESLEKLSAFFRNVILIS